MLKQTLAACTVVALSTGLAFASTPLETGASQPVTPAFESYEVAQTNGMDRRQDRRGTRQDCRQDNGALGKDKRDCKQDSRGS